MLLQGGVNIPRRYYERTGAAAAAAGAGPLAAAATALWGDASDPAQVQLAGHLPW